MVKAILVVTTWTHCGNCSTFKNQGHLKAIEDRYRNDSDINVVVITLSGKRGDNMDEIKKSYPKFVQYMVMYPSFFLVTADTWNNQSTKSLKLAAYKIKLNPDFSFVLETNNRGQNSPVMEPGYTFKSSAIIEWADEQLRNNLIFKQSENKTMPNKTSKSHINHNDFSSNGTRNNGQTGTRNYGRGRNLPNLGAPNDNAENDNYRVVIVRNNRTILSEEIPAAAAQKLIDAAQKLK